MSSMKSRGEAQLSETHIKKSIYIYIYKSISPTR